MKKIMMLFLVLLFLMSTKNVFAQDQYKLTLEKQDGIYMSRRGANYDDDSYPFYIYKMDGMFAYCIEPGKHITTYTYTGVDDFVDLDFSEELLEKLELIGYYGRDYKGHNNVRYSMATQALIWELTGVDKVTFWTKQYEKGEEIDVTKERNEIMSLVNNHKTLPNLKSSYYANLKHKMSIYDTNKVLDDYEIEDNGNQEVYIENNTLYINPINLGTNNIVLKRKKYDFYKTIIFVGKGDGSSQKLARFRYSKDIKAKITINVEGIPLMLHKVDENNNPVYVSDIKFKIKNKNTGEYICSGLPNCIHTTDSYGIFLTESLDYGEYEIEELEDQIIPGYSINKEKLTVNLSPSEEYTFNEEMPDFLDVYFKNNSVPASLEINKKGEKAVFNNNTVSYQDINLSNIYFDLYTSDNKYIQTIITDNNGYAIVNNLKVGKYYLIEKTKLNGYIEKDKIPFEIKQDNQYQTSVNYKLNIKNELKKGNLEFSKTDFVTSEGIPNTIIEIYNDKDMLLFTKETDNNGKVIIDNLPLGKYYIKEKQANYYYEKTDEIVYFEIKNNGEIIKANMSNKKILGTLELEKTGEKYEIVDNKIVYQDIKLGNIIFELFDENDNFITLLETNDDGYVKYDKLPLGKYYLKEKTNLDNYIINKDKIYFEIKKENNQVIPVKLNIENYLKKGNLLFSKIDLATSEGIPNTIVEIYDENNNLWFTKETNNDGEVMINDLPVGKYYIVEKEANSLYLITNEKVFFEIKDNSEIVKAVMTNEKIEVEVPKTSTKESLIANIIFGITSLLGIGRMHYERKKTH